MYLIFAGIICIQIFVFKETNAQNQRIQVFFKIKKKCSFSTKTRVLIFSVASSSFKCPHLSLVFRIKTYKVRLSLPQNVISHSLLQHNAKKQLNEFKNVCFQLFVWIQNNHLLTQSHTGRGSHLKTTRSHKHSCMPSH